MIRAMFVLLRGEASHSYFSVARYGLSGASVFWNNKIKTYVPIFIILFLLIREIIYWMLQEQYCSKNFSLLACMYLQRMEYRGQEMKKTYEPSHLEMTILSFVVFEIPNLRIQHPLTPRPQPNVSMWLLSLPFLLGSPFRVL